MRVEAHINLAALKNNLAVVKSFAPQQKMLAMIKANGYGHGAMRVAQTLQQADAFGVACLEEALPLREAKIKQPIVLMAGVSSAEDLKIAAQHQLDIVLHHQSQVEILLKTSLKKPIRVWLKVDTGMHRLGFPAEKVAEVYQQLLSCTWVQKPFTVMTHFAEADVPDSATTKKQLEKFAALTKNFSGAKSLANSAGIIAWPNSHADWVRPGIMLYGVSPFKTRKASDIKLQPVMTLQSQIIAINYLKKGDAIGYCGTWVCPEDMPVGVVSLGYGDGYPRYAKSGTPVFINGVRCALVGRVSMDMITIDLRNSPQTKIGDQVILWGRNLPAEEVAIWIDTIPYTLFCGVTSRVKYVEINNEKNASA